MGQTAAAWADNAADAKAHYQSATAFFAVGEFAKAADEYQQAYTLKPDPALLYNAAQSYRLAGNNERAIILYKNYVSLYPDQANVDEVRNQIAKLKDAIAAQENAKNNPPTNTVPPTS
jgi:tetratricopeptide (TPR) repeat protein